MKIMRKYRYTILAIFALISCLVYNSYGDTKSRSKQRALEPVPLIGEKIEGKKTVEPGLAIDFSEVGTVEKIDGVDEHEKNGGDCYSKTEQTVTVLMAQN